MSDLKDYRGNQQGSKKSPSLDGRGSLNLTSPSGRRHYKASLWQATGNCKFKIRFLTPDIRKPLN